MKNPSLLDNTNKTFLDLIIVIIKWRNVIFVNVLVITVLAIIISFSIPKWYTSTVNIMPPKSKGGLLGDISSFSSTIKDLSKTLGRLGTVSDEAYNYLAILQSRTSSEKIIDKFNLREVYEFDNDEPIEKIINELQDNVKFNVEDEGNITIKVIDESPKRAAEIANSYVEVLNEISIKLATSEAENNREFIERRYKQSLSDIKQAEDSLKLFSQKYSVYSISEQTKAAITVAAELKTKIETQIIELDILKRNYGSDNPAVLEKQTVINEMKKRLKAMNFEEVDKKNNISLFTPFSQLSEVGVKFLRIRGEYELQAKILEFLVPIYEQAKIEEKKDIPVCLILDKAVPAQEKTGPKRAYIVSAAFLITFIFTLLWVFFVESLYAIRKDENKYRKIHEGIIIPLKKMLFIKNK